jgi:hypothetical protein
MKRRGTVLLALLFTILGPSLTPRIEAQGSDRERAESAATGFLQVIEQGDLRSAYRERTSSSFRQNANEEAFVSQFSILRNSLGGPGSGRQLIDARPLNQIPNTSLQGTFYFLRYKTRYPVGNAYEDVYLEKDRGAWKVLGSWFYPAPL